MRFGRSRRIFGVALLAILTEAAVIAGVHRFASFDYLLQRTLFKVDVVRLRLDVDPATAEAVGAIVDAGDRSRDREEAVVATYLEARHADIALEFRMGIGFDRFIDSGAKNSRRQVKAELLTPEAARQMIEERRELFGFLTESGIREGDRILYTLRGDSVTTRFIDAGGRTRLDALRIGPERRRALLGSYFLRGSNFHDGLMDLVFDER